MGEVEDKIDGVLVSTIDGVMATLMQMDFETWDNSEWAYKETPEEREIALICQEMYPTITRHDFGDEYAPTAEDQKKWGELLRVGTADCDVNPLKSLVGGRVAAKANAIIRAAHEWKRRKESV